MTDTETVNEQVTDGVTHSNVTVLASTPAYALAQSELAFAQSQGVLFANMVSGQQQQAIAGSAAALQCVKQLLNKSGGTSQSGNTGQTNHSVMSTAPQTSFTESVAEKLAVY